MPPWAAFGGWGSFAAGLGTFGYCWENSVSSNTQQFCTNTNSCSFLLFSWVQICLIGPRDKPAVEWKWDFTIFLIFHSKCCRILISAASLKCSSFLLYNPILHHCLEQWNYCSNLSKINSLCSFCWNISTKIFIHALVIFGFLFLNRLKEPEKMSKSQRFVIWLADT